MVFNATFNNISVLLVKETGVPRENHRPVTKTIHKVARRINVFVINEHGICHVLRILR